MTNRVQEQAEQWHAALDAVRGQCDGAHALDGVGFSKFDREDADYLLDQDVASWDGEDRDLAHKLVVKYQRQIGELGFHVEQLLERVSLWRAKPAGYSAKGDNGTPAGRVVLPQSMPRPASGTYKAVLPPPPALDLPGKFTAWRNGQDKAVCRALDSPKRFVVLALPTGAGKSLCYLAAAKLHGGRAAILTATKALQSQIHDDFASVGLCDIRGANNYTCLAAESEGQRTKWGGVIGCDHGKCRGGLECALLSAGCLYFDAARIAKRADIVSTNYAYWMVKQSLTANNAEWDNEGKSDPTLGKFDLLVLDEAHEAPDELGNYLAAEIDRAECEMLLGFGFPAGADEFTEFSQWQPWASDARDRAESKLVHLKAQMKLGVVSWHREVWQVRALEKLADDFAKIARAGTEWLFEIMRKGSERRTVAQFNPVWPGPYAEQCLFHGVEKVILTSATVRPKTLELLGVDPSDVDFVEFASVFPVERRPVIQVPAIRVDKNADRAMLKVWVSKIDRIIEARQDRKGIIHTVSYARAKLILELSEYRHIMLLHETRSVRDIVEIFKTAPPPLVLVSPSVDTGFDFPMDQCRYQIIAKVPFPDTRNRIMAARTKGDPEYPNYLAMLRVVQACGRGNRSEQDWCENLILDDHWGWFKGKWRKFAPQWFLAACCQIDGMPKPMGEVESER